MKLVGYTWVHTGFTVWEGGKFKMFGVYVIDRIYSLGGGGGIQNVWRLCDRRA